MSFFVHPLHQTLTWKQYSPINSHRKAPVSSSQHYDHQYELAQGMPSAAERIMVLRQSCALTYITECGYGLEEDGVDVEALGWNRECVALDNANEEATDEDPPHV